MALTGHDASALWALKVETHLRTVIGPRSELHRTVLEVKGKEGNVYGAR